MLLLQYDILVFFFFFKTPCDFSPFEYFFLSFFLSFFFLNLVMVLLFLKCDCITGDKLNLITQFLVY